MGRGYLVSDFSSWMRRPVFCSYSQRKTWPRLNSGVTHLLSFSAHSWYTVPLSPSMEYYSHPCTTIFYLLFWGLDFIMNWTPLPGRHTSATLPTVFTFGETTIAFFPLEGWLSWVWYPWVTFTCKLLEVYHTRLISPRLHACVFEKIFILHSSLHNQDISCCYFVQIC